MFVAGDEFLNTQRGNNNPYNQDNEITWLDWARLEDNRDIFRFFKLMIAFRKSHPSIGRPTFWREDVSWHGADGPVDLGHESRRFAYSTCRFCHVHLTAQSIKQSAPLPSLVW